VTTLALRLCGNVALTDAEGIAVSPPLGSKTLGLLAFLALEPGPHRREQLTALLWGDYPEDRAKASLRQALTHLRDALGDILRVDRSFVEIVGPLSCDVSEFLRRRELDSPGATEIDVTQFLAGLTVRSCPAFDEWADAKRLQLRSAYSRLLGNRVREALARRAWRDARQLAEKWSAVDPFADEPMAALIEAHFLGGDRDTALATYSRHVARLTAETGRTPGRALAEVAARVEHATDHATGHAPRARLTTESWYEQAPSFSANLVGRNQEWETLTRAWDLAASEASRVVLIEGEPGVGKSRLAEEFLRWVTSQGGVVLRGRGYDARAGAPFGAVIEALHSALDAPGLAGVDPEWLVEVARVLPELRKRFPGLADAAPVSAAADGWRLFESVAQVILAIAEENPIAVLIDDLQWCDADSCGLLNFLVRRLADARVLWCATFTLGEVERDAPAARFSRALRSGRGAASVTLRPLSEDDVWSLIRDLGRVGAPTGGRRLAARIHEVTAGNPFYVIELLKTLFAQELLTVDPATGAWIVPPSALANTVWPVLAPTVHDAVSDRIECLPDELHAVLISIAAAGRGCRTDVLSHLHGISRLHAAMLGDALVERHLVLEEEGVYRCAHPTIGHVVRAKLTTSRRREVHRALAMALELLLPSRGRDGGELGEIASHAEQAGDNPMAYRYALLASDAANRRCAYDEALSWLDLASGTAGSPAETEVVDRTTAQVLKQAGWREAPPVRAPQSGALQVVERSDFDLPAGLVDAK
jgi:DNA-binding SARP family transcriptional activator